MRKISRISDHSETSEVGGTRAVPQAAPQEEVLATYALSPEYHADLYGDEEADKTVAEGETRPKPEVPPLDIALPAEDTTPVQTPNSKLSAAEQCRQRIQELERKVDEESQRSQLVLGQLKELRRRYTALQRTISPTRKASAPQLPAPVVPAQKGPLAPSRSVTAEFGLLHRMGSGYSSVRGRRGEGMRQSCPGAGRACQKANKQAAENGVRAADRAEEGGGGAEQGTI